MLRGPLPPWPLHLLPENVQVDTIPESPASGTYGTWSFIQQFQDIAELPGQQGVRDLNQWDEGASAATAEKGKLLLDEILNGVTAVIEDMLE